MAEAEIFILSRSEIVGLDKDHHNCGRRRHIH